MPGSKLRAMSAGLQAPIWRAYVALEPWGFLASFVALALAERVGGVLRRRRARPRLIWGPVPMISLKFWSGAMRERGFESTTCVTHHYAVHRQDDFDVYRDRFTDGSQRPERLADYRYFRWTLRRGDVFVRFLDGGTSATPGSSVSRALCSGSPARN